MPSFHSINNSKYSGILKNVYFTLFPRFRAIENIVSYQVSRYWILEEYNGYMIAKDTYGDQTKWFEKPDPLIPLKYHTF